mmetsp:Transcript_31362/g.66783  ORF Transcript_31362/g.66783 Transcript_31362/m.66783 type:complete len:126 (-) Transcript_31362:108-485(-)
MLHLQQFMGRRRPPQKKPLPTLLTRTRRARIFQMDSGEICWGALSMNSRLTKTSVASSIGVSSNQARLLQMRRNFNPETENVGSQQKQTIHSRSARTTTNRSSCGSMNSAYHYLLDDAFCRELDH